MIKETKKLTKNGVDFVTGIQDCNTNLHTSLANLSTASITCAACLQTQATNTTSDISSLKENKTDYTYKEDMFSEKINLPENFLDNCENEELHPNRYGGDTPYECKKVLEEWYSNNSNINGYEAWLLGTIVKYCNRFGKKDDKLKEAKKIEVYAKFLREFEEKNN